jgi:hypothetical protein
MEETYMTFPIIVLFVTIYKEYVINELMLYFYKTQNGYSPMDGLRMTTGSLSICSATKPSDKALVYA